MGFFIRRSIHTSMLNTVSLVSQTSALIVNLQDLKEHLGIVGTQDDVRLNLTLQEAQDAIAAETGLVFLSSTWLETYDAFPAALETVKAPVSAIVSLQYYDDTNTLQTLVQSNGVVPTGGDFYAVMPDYQPAVLYPANSEPRWQPVYHWRPDAVQLTYQTTNPISAPSLRIAQRAIKILCGYWNEQRGDPTDKDFPPGLERLLKLLRPAVYA
jgi:hypothetical protein